MSMLLLSLAAYGADPVHKADPQIEAHLFEVVETLRAETPGHLSPDVRRRRLAYLDALERYAWAGEFPDNVTGRGHPREVAPPRGFAPSDPATRAPVFVDDDGSHCAVGYLMAIEAPELVSRVVGEANLEWLPEMQVPGVEGWARSAGFTLDELAWIQPSYTASVPDCAHFTPVVSAPPVTGACGGVDVTVLPGDLGCIDACTDFQLWVPVGNQGSTDAGMVHVEVLGAASGTLLASADLPGPAAGTSAALGPIPVVGQEYALTYRITTPGDCDPTNDEDDGWQVGWDSGIELVDHDGDGFAPVGCGGVDCDDLDPANITDTNAPAGCDSGMPPSDSDTPPGPGGTPSTPADSGTPGGTPPSTPDAPAASDPAASAETAGRSGCGCAVGPGAGAGAWLALFGLAALRRRRFG